MRNLLLPLFGAVLACATACKAPPPDPKAPSVPAESAIAENSCFWNGPWVREDPERNYAFPDSAAAYWTSRFELPAKGKLVIEGRFPRARYVSLVAYDGDGRPTDVLTDYTIEPVKGHQNPYRPGVERNVETRSFRVEAVDGRIPETRAPNTLYLDVGAMGRAALILRVYVPDQGLGRTGGVPLPAVRLQNGEGKLLDEAETCKTLAANREPMPSSVPTRAVYEMGRGRVLESPTFPAQDPPVWHAFYNPRQLGACVYFGRCDGNAERTGGIYSNPDNAYVVSMINRGYSPVLLLTGHMPVIVPTSAGGGRMQEGELRYWSLCNNETATQKVMSCLYDEQVPLDADRDYRIVVSRREDRPSNARPECGIAWLEWLPSGDGAGHADDGMLFLRTMLPAPGYNQGVQSTRAPGDEREVMGDVLPVAEYQTREQIERLGCP